VGYKPHHSHFSLAQALELAERIGAKHTWLTHLSHTFPRHEDFCRELPPTVQPAFDGLIIND
jgi:phosphoribosyl 1,2-cyclic phosphate phosphodiesterase